MHHFWYRTSKCDLPGAASPEQAALGLERWVEAANGADSSTDAAGGLGQFAEEAANDPRGRRLLDSVFGNSPFLTSSIINDPEFFRGLLSDGPDETFSGIVEGLKQSRENGEGLALNDKDLARLLRIAKRRMALTVAIADITGAWPLEKITGALSDFAEAVLGIPSAHGPAR